MPFDGGNWGIGFEGESEGERILVIGGKWGWEERRGFEMNGTEDATHQHFYRLLGGRESAQGSFIGKGFEREDTSIAS